MTVGSDEFIKLQENFEKNIDYCIKHGHRVERETGKVKGIFYTDGYVNDLFKAYMLGYSFKRVLDL